MKDPYEEYLKAGVMPGDYTDCPHYQGQIEGVARCKFNEMRPCIYEVVDIFVRNITNF